MASAVIFVWYHPVSVVAAIGSGIGQALSSLGFDVKYLNIMDDDFDLSVSNPEILNCDLAISIAALPLARRIGDRWLFEVVGKEFYLYSLDSIIYDHSRVSGVAEFLEASKVSPRLGILTPNRDACPIINEFSRGTCSYLPLSAVFLPFPPVEIERLRRVVVIGTIGSELADVPPDQSFDDVVLAAPAAIPADRLAKFAREIERPHASLDTTSVARNFLGISAETIFTFEVTRYLSRLDAFQKRRRRRLAVSALRDIPIDFFGEGWERYTADFRDCRHMGTMPYREMGSVLQRYSALLNFDPNWGHGLLDRVFASVGNGCRLLTNESPALSELNLPDPDAVLTYDANNPILARIANRALSLPPLDPTRLLTFRLENSWLARMEHFFLRELVRD